MSGERLHLPHDLAHHGELSANVVGFCRFLRAQGAGSGPGEEKDCLLALEHIDLTQPQQFRTSLRTCLAKSLSEQAIFDASFQQYWDVWARAAELGRPRPEEGDEADERGDDESKPQTSTRSIVDWLKGDSRDSEDEEEETAAYSPIEVLTKRDFRFFGAGETDEISRVITLIARILARRFKRRYRAGRRRGRLDLRRTLRTNLRRGGELVDLAYKRRRQQRLDLVLLCDVSRSMDLYSRFLIQFVYAFQVACRRVETFAFSTSLSRITDALDGGDFDETLETIGEQVPQWSGGTRIGACLDAFLSSWGESTLSDRTVVIILSDGWDTGDIELLSESMRQIRRRAHSVIWLNPLLGYEAYEPDTAGMRAALPYVDLFSSAHNAASLRDLARRLTQLPRRARPRPFPRQFTGPSTRPQAVEPEMEVDVSVKTPPRLPSSAANLMGLARKFQEKKARRNSS